MDPSRDGGGGLTATGLFCGPCGTELRPNSKFCNECGAPLTHATRSAEYKQVTVLFADVVHSMDIAATLGAERPREIMIELANEICSPGRAWFSARSVQYAATTAPRTRALTGRAPALARPDSPQTWAVVATGWAGRRPSPWRCGSRPSRSPPAARGRRT